MRMWKSGFVKKVDNSPKTALLLELQQIPVTHSSLRIAMQFVITSKYVINLPFYVDNSGRVQ